MLYPIRSAEDGRKGVVELLRMEQEDMAVVRAVQAIVPMRQIELLVTRSADSLQFLNTEAIARYKQFRQIARVCHITCRRLRGTST